MVAKIIEWSVKNRALVIILLLMLVAVAIWSTMNLTVDALPDLSDVQVIIRTEFPGQSPEIIEDQITYPLTTTLLGLPGARTVRGFSMVGTSFVYIIFEDGTDIYWARSRVMEQLSSISSSFPEGVTPQLGPDATGVGWIFQYVLLTGKYSPDYPNGLWRDSETKEWFAENNPAKKLAKIKIFNSEVLDENGKEYLRCPISGKLLVDANVDLSELRSIQDWYLRYELASLDGVSEVAPIGGFVRQYQITVDPNKLRAFNLNLSDLKQRVKMSNNDVGGRIIEQAETEYLVRSRANLGTLPSSSKGNKAANSARVVIEQMRKISLGVTEGGMPIYLEDVADIGIGPEIRRGVAEWNGTGETVGAIVVMRYGENASRTIEAVKTKLAELKNSLPSGVDIAVGYDRSDLIDRAIETLSETLLEEMLIVTIVCMLFLLHARSALVAIIVLPSGVLISLLIMSIFGINANIMSLGGIAIAIGVMVDSSIAMVENAHNHLERENDRRKAGKKPRSHTEVIVESAKEVGPTLFFSLLIITISFLPVFALQEQAGRLFKPLAFTKTFSMAAAAILAITLIPPLMVYFVKKRVVPKQLSLISRITIYGSVIILPALALWLIPLNMLLPYRSILVWGWVVLSALIILPQKIIPELKNPLSRLLSFIYNPFFVFAMRFRWMVIIGSIVLVLITILPLMQLGSEFMPALEEGDFLYMPNAYPGLSITKAKELLQQTDKLMMQFPEVVSVMGKVGRSETATDPAPLTMIETTIMLERDKSKWRQVPTSGWDSFFKDKRPITLEELVDGYQLEGDNRVPGLNDALNIPGLTGALTRGSMPIKTRIDMLSTGIRTAVGVKVMGTDLAEISIVNETIASLLLADPELGKHTVSAYADKQTGGHYIDIDIDREGIARHGLTIAAVQDVISTAIGGMTFDYTIEGRERYPINLRYHRDYRDNINDLSDILISTPIGAQVPLGEFAEISYVEGPPMIKSENGRLTGWVFIDVKNIDLVSYVEKADQLIRARITLPEGISIKWSGQYEYLEKANRILQIVIPIVLLAILVLLYISTKSWFRTILIMLTLSFSAVGAIWMLYFMGFNLSIAVWVGVIALLGLDAETSLLMLLYLDKSVERAKKSNLLKNANDLWIAIHHGAVKRIRPKTMTVVTTFAALLPLLFNTGAGADTLKRLAAPMIGGLITSFILELLIYPVVMYVFYKNRMENSIMNDQSDCPVD